jgi:allophanate hydrolase
VSVFATTVGLATRVVDLLAGPDPDDPWSRSRPAAIARPPSFGGDDRGPLRVAVPSQGADGQELPGLDPAAVAALVAATGAVTVAATLSPYLAAGRLLYEGAFVAERYEAVGAFLETDPPGVDPVVGSIIRAAGRLPAWQLARDRTTAAALRAQLDEQWRTADVLVLPTVPRIPTVAEVLAEPVAVNTALGTYTNAVNVLDLCAVSVPVAPPGVAGAGGVSGAGGVAGPPASLMLVAPAWHDDLLAAVAGRLEEPGPERR